MDIKIKVNKFCSLSTSPSWQAWLFHFSAELYRKFMGQIQQSRGCNQNRDIMIELLKEIDRIGGTDKLLVFLHAHYPHMLVDSESPSAKIGIDDQIFPYFNPALMTYPRRRIIEGADLKQRVQEFLLDKLQSDYVIVGDRAYIEYLDRKDAEIAKMVPIKSWKISVWRLKSNSEQKLEHG